MAHDNFRVDPLTGKLTMTAISGGGTELPQVTASASTLAPPPKPSPTIVVLPARSVTGAAVNQTGHLIITYSDSTSEDLGRVKGASGTNAKTILSGVGAPAGGTGTNGDFYIDTTAHSIYGPKGSPNPGWGSPTSIAFVPEKAPLSVDATDLASALVLINELKAVLVANGFAE